MLNTNCPHCGDRLPDHYASIFKTIDEVLCDKCNYIECGEPDGCWYCGRMAHRTLECAEIQISDVPYRAGYSYAAGYQD